MPAVLLDVIDVHLVDETMLALSGYLGLRRIGLVRPHVIFLQRRQHRLHASIHLCLVIAGAVLGKQELQDERRDVGAFLDSMQQVLA